jgi:hypothetical protein
VNILSDNTTAVSYINHMGGVKSPCCNSLAKSIWFWAKHHKIWLTASHIAGKDNKATLNNLYDFLFHHNSIYRQFYYHSSPLPILKGMHQFVVPPVDYFCSKLIREATRVLGLLVSSFSGVDYGQLFYKEIEVEKIQALKLARGNFDLKMQISENVKCEMTSSI